MQKFLVVSHDNDEDQWFWDFVMADDEEDAEGQVCEARDYVNGASAIDQKHLDGLV